MSTYMLRYTAFQLIYQNIKFISQKNISLRKHFFIDKVVAFRAGLSNRATTSNTGNVSFMYESEQVMFTCRMYESMST